MKKKSRSRLIIESNLGLLAFFVVAAAMASTRVAELPWWITDIVIAILFIPCFFVFRLGPHWRQCTDPITPAERRLARMFRLGGASLLMSTWFVVALLVQIREMWIVFVVSVGLLIFVWHNRTNDL